MSTERKIALVLSGGGAKGAFQIGALNYIIQKVMPRYPGFKFSIIAGVSVGSLNGVMLAQNNFPELWNLWNMLENKDVYKGRINVAGFVWRLLRGKKSLLSSDPLKELIGKYISLEKLDPEIRFRMGTVSLVTGNYHYFQPSDFTNNIELRKAVLASAVMPVIWEPVEKISASGQEFLDMVDGGIRNISPLEDVLNFHPDEVIVINCSPFNKPIPTDALAGSSLFQIAKRSLIEIAMNEIFLGDLRGFLRINKLVLQAEKQNVSLLDEKGRTLKAYKTILINPEADLGDMLDFSQNSIQARLKKGYKAAEKAFETYTHEKDQKLHTNLTAGQMDKTA